MSKIKTLDRTALINLRAPIEAELAALGERLGVSLKLGNGSFSPSGADASFKLILTVDDPETKAKAAQAEWNMNCRFVGIDFASPETTGLRPEDLGTEFTYAGTLYRTTGVAVRGKGSQKFPILALAISGKVAAGKTMMLPESAVPLIRAATDAKAAAA